jgi:hypothetical protein
VTDLVAGALIAAGASVTSAIVSALAVLLKGWPLRDRRRAHRPRLHGERRKDHEYEP